MADNGEKKRSFTGTEMRLILRRARIGTLSTLSADDGGPYGSLANIATDVDGRPLLFVSRLALHTQNLLKDGRASIMVGEVPEKGDALVGQRISVMGQFEQVEDAALKQRYLARHPAATFYSEFPDFSLWRMTVARVHGVAGFGRIETLPAEEVFPTVPGFAELAFSALEHMNEDHAPAIQLYAQKLLKRSEEGWTMAAIDTDGADLVHGQSSAYLPFPRPAVDADELRHVFAELSAKARSN